ncbi:MAG TPA: ParA family protein [Clostridiaceae bacterium]|nr:ParA family protein [Clostridiaceae bacterium]
MEKILAIVNQKGGVGKTTTCINLSAYLAVRGKRTLLIDLDPQGNASSGLGMDKNNLGLSTYDVLINNEPISDVSRETSQKNLWICPSNIDLAGAEVEMVSIDKREFILKNAMKDINNQFDLVIIDCPPSLGNLTLNALVAADGCIVPIQGEYYALEGLTQLLNTINIVKGSLNPDLDIFGVVLTMFDGRTQLANQVNDEVRKFFGEKVFNAMIPRNVRLSEAPGYGLPINVYDKRSKGAAAYLALAKEVIKRIRKER